MSPVGKSHGLAVMRIARALQAALGGHTLAEVGVATAIGVRAPGVAWCSDGYLASHSEEAPLSSAPEIRVEIVSASNALPRLRETAMAYVNDGAVEAWIVHPTTRRIEVYARDGRRESTSFPVDAATVLG
jgi:Uma2 family endonuclease